VETRGRYFDLGCGLSKQPIKWFDKTGFLVPDDLNIKSRGWMLEFHEEVSTKEVLDSLVDLDVKYFQEYSPETYRQFNQKNHRGFWEKLKVVLKWLFTARRAKK